MIIGVEAVFVFSVVVNDSVGEGGWHADNNPAISKSSSMPPRNQRRGINRVMFIARFLVFVVGVRYMMNRRSF